MDHLVQDRRGDQQRRLQRLHGREQLRVIGDDQVKIVPQRRVAHVALLQVGQRQEQLQPGAWQKPERITDGRQRVLDALAADHQALEAACGAGGKDQSVLVIAVGFLRRRAVQRAHIAVIGIQESDMRRPLREQPGMAFGNQQQRNVIVRQQVVIHLAGKVVGEGHCDGADVQQRQVMHQPAIGVGRIDAHPHAGPHAPFAQRGARAHHLVMQSRMGVADNLSAFKGKGRALFVGQFGNQTTQMHRRRSPDRFGYCPPRQIPAAAFFSGGPLAPKCSSASAKLLEGGTFCHQATFGGSRWGPLTAWR